MAEIRGGLQNKSKDTHKPSWLGTVEDVLKKGGKEFYNQKVEKYSKTIADVHRKLSENTGEESLSSAETSLEQIAKEARTLNKHLEKLEDATTKGLIKKKINRLSQDIRRLRAEVNRLREQKKEDDDETSEKKKDESEAKVKELKKQIQESSNKRTHLLVREVYRLGKLFVIDKDGKYKYNSALLQDQQKLLQSISLLERNNISLEREFDENSNKLIWKLKKAQDDGDLEKIDELTEAIGEIYEEAEDNFKEIKEAKEDKNKKLALFLKNKLLTQYKDLESLRESQGLDEQLNPKEIDLDEKSTVEFTNRLKKEQKRYRRSAQISSYINTLAADGKNLSPGRIKKLNELLKEHFKDLQALKESGNNEHAEDRALAKAKEQIVEHKEGQETGLIEQGKELDLENLSFVYKDSEQTLSEHLEGITDVTERQEIIKAANKAVLKELFGNLEGNQANELAGIDAINSDMQRSLGDPEATDISKLKSSLGKAFLQTSYSEQMRYFFEENNGFLEEALNDDSTSSEAGAENTTLGENQTEAEEDPSKSKEKTPLEQQKERERKALIKLTSGFVAEHMKEFERQQQLEKEATPEAKSEMLSAFYRSRVIEEFTNLENLRSLLGDRYAEMAQKEGFSVFDKDGVYEEIDKEVRELAEEMFKLENNPNLMNEEGENAGQDSEGEAQNRLNTEKERTLERMEKNKANYDKLKANFDSEGRLNSESKIKIENAIKADLRKAVLEARSLNQTEASQAENPEFEQEIEKLINEIFAPTTLEINGPSTNTKEAFKLIQTPAGIGIVFAPKKAQQIHELIFGEDARPDQDANASNGTDKESDEDFENSFYTEKQEPYETLGFSITNSEEFKKIVGDDFDGEIQVIATGQNENPDTLIHEVQHGFMHAMAREKNQDLKTTAEQAQIEKSIEELAVRLANGDLWQEFFESTDKQSYSSQRLSFAANTYLTKDFYDNLAPDSPEKAQIEALKEYFELAKEITARQMNSEVVDKYKDDLGKFNDITKINPFYINRYGEVLSNILLSSRDSNGKVDVKQALNSLMEFASIKKKGQEENQQGSDAGSEDSAAGTQALNSGLTDSDFYGENFNPENPADAAYKAKLKLASESKSLVFDMINIPDFRGRTNATFDAHFDTKVSNYTSTTVDPIASYDLPFGMQPVMTGINRLFTGKRQDPGPMEWDSFKGGTNLGNWLHPFNYNYRGRAYGGIIRKLQQVPVIGLPFKLVPEPRTKFGTSFNKVFNDLPPFGKGWEHIMNQYAPALKPIMKNRFPGRPQAYDTVSLRTDQMQPKYQEVIQSTWGEGGLGLTSDIQRRLTLEFSDAGVSIDERGQLQQVKGIGVYDQKDATGVHLGTLRRNDGADDDFILALRNEWKSKNAAPGDPPEDFGNGGFMNGNESGPSGPQPFGFGSARAKYEKDRGKARKARRSNSGVLGLAEHLQNSYNKDNYSYTFHDLYKASIMAQDLGVNPMDTSSVRNSYYEGDFNSRGFRPTRVDGRNLMVGDYIWYDLDDPGSRGVVIGQGDLRKFFTVEDVNEFFKRYEAFNVYKALKEGVPDISERVQMNRYDAAGPIRNIAVTNTDGTVISREIEMSGEFVDKMPELIRGFFRDKGAFLEGIFKDSYINVREYSTRVTNFLMTRNENLLTENPAKRNIFKNPPYSNFNELVKGLLDEFKDYITSPDQAIYFQDLQDLLDPATKNVIPNKVEKYLYDLWAFNRNNILQQDARGRSNVYELRDSKYAWEFDVATKTHKIRHSNTSSLNKYYNTGSIYGGRQAIRGLSANAKLAKEFLLRASEDLGSVEGGLKDGFEQYNEVMMWLNDVSRMERKAYYSKTFWGDFKKWTQRTGKLILGASAVAACATGAPVFAGIFLGWGAWQLLAVNYSSVREATSGAGRMKALELQGTVHGALGMFSGILQGNPPDRLEAWNIKTRMSDLEAKVEDIGKLKAEGAFDENDLMNSLVGRVFGEKGIIASALGA